MKKTVYYVPENSDNSTANTWPKFLMQVVGIFTLLFVMVKIIQAFAE